jgi:Fe-S-cluster containining protein
MTASRHETLCRRCGGKCCKKGPEITIEEFDQMAAIIGASRVMNAGLIEIPSNRYRFREQCPALTPRGCLLLHDQRPRTCQLYPFVEVGGKLILDPACEHWRVFGEDYPKIAKKEVVAEL